MKTPNLDVDVLRTLLATTQLGSLRKAADFVGRSQSAVSQQLRKLEDQVDQPLFRRQSKRLALTEAGELILSYGKRMIELNDEAVRAVRGTSVEGVVRFGLPGDFSETWLPLALGRFKRLHKGVRVEIAVDKNGMLLERLDRGELDMVLVMGYGKRDDAKRITTMAMSWIGPAEAPSTSPSDQPLDLALYNAPCFFRQAGIAALDNAHVPWHLAYTTSSLQSLWAGVTAGFGITVRTASGLPATLRCLSEEDGLPPLPGVELCLHAANRPLSHAATELWDAVTETVLTNIHSR
jgi:DNA-binding transcriptional LysR family regulator